MYKRVQILRGKLQEPTEFWVGLAYQLTRRDGTPCSFSYTGPAGVEGNTVTIAHGTHVETFTVASEPTEESRLFYKGFSHGMRQARRRMPASKPEAYLDGWQAAWRERRP